jgi:DNA-binding NarL/FixJ family response regulator
MALLHLSQEELEPESNAGKRPRIRVLIALSAELERLGWGIIVSSQPDMQLIAQAASCDEALAVLSTHPSDVTLIDETILETGQCSALQEYSKPPWSSRFVLVAPHHVDYSLEHSRYAFTHAYLLKGVSAEELLGTIRTTAEGSVSWPK